MAYSRQRAVSDGTLQRLDVAISYIRREDINVLLDGAQTGNWSWAGNSDAIQFPSPIPNGVEVTLVRTTQSNKVIHEFAKGAKFVNTSVDQDFLQMLYLAQEYTEGGGQSEFFTDVDMHGYKLVNLGTAINPGDAVPFSQVSNIVIDAESATEAARQAASSATSASVSANALRVDLANPSVGGRIVARKLVTSPAVPTNITNVDAKLDDMETTARADFGALSFARGDEALPKFDATDSLQSMLASQYLTLGAVQFGSGYFSTGPLLLGDPALDDYTFPSGQKARATNVKGRGWALSGLFARASRTTDPVVPFIRATNTAGVNYEGFAAYARKLSNTVFDFAWRNNPPGRAAPSNQCVYRSLYADGGVVVGFNFDNVHDSLIEDIRSTNSPIGLRMVGGGGQNQLTNVTITGLTQICGQNTSIRDSGLFGGLHITGNSENRLAIYNTQIFPIGTQGLDPAIPSYLYNYAIHAVDSGTYGANILLENCSIFSAGNCITGKFHSGLTARNSLFTVAAGGSLLFGITSGGNAGDKPMFRFENCSLPANGSPLGTNPATYDWEIVNCRVGSTLVRYASNRSRGTWTPAGVGVLLTNNTQARWHNVGGVATLFCDVSFPTNTDAGPARISGLPIPMANPGSSVNVTFHQYGPSYAIGGYVDVGSGSVYLNKLGVGNPTLTNAEIGGARMMLCIQYGAPE